MKGWIYIARNPSYEGLLKIGYSDRDPSIRMEELYSTGVPTPFVQLYVVLVDNAYEVEQKIHDELDFCRDSKSREFFRCELEKVLTVFDNLKKNLDEVFFDFCNQLVPPSKQILKTVEELVEYDKNVSSISREINRLDIAIKNSKQFNKKVELNMELKIAQQKLNDIKYANTKIFR